jgi:hypothetical protein
MKNLLAEVTADDARTVRVMIILIKLRIFILSINRG